MKKEKNAFEIYEELQKTEQVFQPGDLIITKDKTNLFFTLMMRKNNQTEENKERLLRSTEILKVLETFPQKALSLKVETPLGKEREVEGKFYRLATKTDIKEGKIRSLFNK